MSNKQDKWERLINMTDEYDPDPNLANEIIDKINQRESTVQFRTPVKVWIPLLSFFILCAICLAVFLPIFLHKSKVEKIYYSNESIEYAPIDNIDKFIQDNGLAVFYYSNVMGTAQAAISREKNELLYITQDFLCPSETGFDMLKLRIVLFQDIEFEFNKNFEALPLSLIVADFNVSYNMNNLTNNLIRAKFTNGEISYYLEITTSDESTTTLENYIKLLID